jgi:hypothetical protein
MPIVLKVKFGDDTRRLTLEREPTFGELVELIGKLYVNLPTNYAVKYIDEDEDQVTIGSDLELNEAIRISGGSNAVLRLFITGTTSTSQASESSQQFPQSLPDLLKAFCPTSTATPNADMPDLVNLFQNLGLNTSVPSTNDPEQLRQHVRTLFQQLFNSPLVINLLPHLMPFMPQMTTFLNSFEEKPVKKEDEYEKNNVVHEGVTCDNCNGLIHGIRYKCSQCWNFDLCESCEQKGTHDKNHILLKIQMPIQHSMGRGCPYNRNNNNLPRWRNRQKHHHHLSRYIADVTIPDGSRMAPSQRFVKTWRIRNEGQAPWPASTFLEHVGGDLIAAGTRVPVEITVEPGSEVEVSVDMIAPEAPGRYVSFWKLSDSEGVRFGQRVWADITVTEIAVDTAAEVTSEAVDTASTEVTEEMQESVMDLMSFPSVENSLESSIVSLESVAVSTESANLEGKVKQLADMGFPDLEMNRKLLEQYGLDMVKTVQELLNS